MSEALRSSSLGTYLKPGQFFGDVLDKRNVHGLILAEFRHVGRKRLLPHSHELAFFNLLLDGAYCETYGKRSIPLRPLTIIFQPPDVVHHDDIGESGVRIFSLEVGKRWLDRLREYASLPETSADLHGGELVWLAMRLYREYREFDCCTPLALEGLALEMLALVARRPRLQEKREPLWLSRVIDLLHAEFHRNLTVEQMAAEAGVHPIHLSRVFRQFHHQSMSEYLHRLRVNFACRQLLRQAAPLAELSSAAGFADQSHFTRVFKRITGMTPGAFRTAVMSGHLDQQMRPDTIAMPSDQIGTG